MKTYIIKKLDWIRCETEKHTPVYYAEHYRIGVGKKSTNASRVIRTLGWSVQCRDLEEAKQRCQDHYEERLQKHLEQAS